MKKVIIVLLLNMFIISPAFAKFEDREHGPWTVEQSDENCHMYMVYEDDTFFYISKSFHSMSMNLSFVNNKWQALKNRIREKVNVELDFDDDLEYDNFTNDQGLISYLEADGDSNSRGLVVTAWGEEVAEDLFVSLALSDSFDLRVDGKHLGSFSLDHSRSALLSLISCQAEGRRNSNIDPFAE